jgi:hypothetical protein
MKDSLFDQRNIMSSTDGVVVRFIRTTVGFNEGDTVRLSPSRAKRFIEAGDAVVVTE